MIMFFYIEKRAELISPITDLVLFSKGILQRGDQGCTHKKPPRELFWEFGIFF